MYLGKRHTEVSCTVLFCNFQNTSKLKGAKIFRVVVENKGSGVGLTGLKSGSAKYWLRDLGQDTQLLCVSVSLPTKWSQWSVYSEDFLMIK